ncbi:MAG: META domain-containing protein [Acidimicrobiales bacterium]
MRRFRPTLFVVLLAVLLGIAAACGDDTAAGDGDTGDDSLELDGRRFWSTSVTEDGADRPLVADTQIEISFVDGQVSARAGCNSMGGEYSLDGDVLIVGDMFSTEIGCDPDRHDQDDFVAAFLTAGPVAALDGKTLTLATDDVTVEFADLSGETESLKGTTWEVTGFVDESAATSFNVTEPASLIVAEDTMTGFDGCDEFAAPVEVADGSTGGPVEGDGELQFGELELVDPSGACTDAEYRDLVHEVLTGAAFYTIENAGPGVSNLTITNTEAGLSMTLTTP